MIKSHATQIFVFTQTQTTKKIYQTNIPIRWEKKFDSKPESRWELKKLFRRRRWYCCVTEKNKRKKISYFLFALKIYIFLLFTFIDTKQCIDLVLN